MSVVVVEHDLVTAYGAGLDRCWQGLLSGKPATSHVKRFNTDSFQCHIAAMVPSLDTAASSSLVMQMLQPLLKRLEGRLPAGTEVILASTTGEIDLLQRELLGGTQAHDSRLYHLLEKTRELLKVSGKGLVVSAACASASAAVAHAGMLIESGNRNSVLVVACDAVSEFVYSGFSSLMALDPEGARPFDRSRKGLTIGEAAGYALLMGSEAARREKRPAICEVAGWGLSCDANHMTGSSRDGVPLSMAIQKALLKSGLAATSIGSISAHGTGTPYNDSMEMKAFKLVFGNEPVPTYSVKGAVGHTMGAAALVDMLVAVKSLNEKVVPPSVNARDIDPEAAGWVSPSALPAPRMDTVLSTNSGFGGINTALVMRA